MFDSGKRFYKRFAQRAPARATMAKTESTLELAPAAGSGIGRQLAKRILGRSDFLDLLEDAVISALKADNRYYSKAAGEMVSYPDAKTRLAAVLGLLAQLEGDPVKRILHFDATRGAASDLDELESALSTSPALRRSVERTLKRAEQLAITEGDALDL